MPERNDQIETSALDGLVQNGYRKEVINGTVVFTRPAKPVVMLLQRRRPGQLTRGVVWPPLSTVLVVPPPVKTPRASSLWADSAAFAVCLMMAWLGLYQLGQMIQLW